MSAKLCASRWIQFQAWLCDVNVLVNVKYNWTLTVYSEYDRKLKLDNYYWSFNSRVQWHGHQPYRYSYSPNH